jgi:hypothetical protein
VQGPAADDGLLGDWLAHYTVFMLVIILIVTGIVGAWAALALPSVEMWSIVVDTNQEVASRQLGVVGEALFQTEDTYTEAMARLGMRGNPEQLYRIVDLKTVPESRLLIVTARTNDRASAAQATDAMAQALVHAFDRSNYPGFRVLGSPQTAPIRSGLSLLAATLAGLVVGVIVALAVSIVHYRLIRPVLTMERAAAALQPSSIASFPGSGRFLGTLRPRPPTVAGGAERRVTPGVLVPGLTLRAPGYTVKERRQLADALGLQDTALGDHVVVVCDPRTRERDLRGSRRMPGASRELLWIA